MGMDVGEDVGVIQAWQDMTKEHEGVAEGGAEEGLVRLRLKELLVNHNKQKVSYSPRIPCSTCFNQPNVDRQI